MPIKQFTFYQWLISTEANISVNPFCCKGFRLTEDNGVKVCCYCGKPRELKKLRIEYKEQLSDDEIVLLRLM